MRTYLSIFVVKSCPISVDGNMTPRWTWCMLSINFGSTLLLFVILAKFDFERYTYVTVVRSIHKVQITPQKTKSRKGYLKQRHTMQQETCWNLHMHIHLVIRNQSQHLTLNFSIKLWSQHSQTIKWKNVYQPCHSQNNKNYCMYM